MSDDDMFLNGIKQRAKGCWLKFLLHRYNRLFVKYFMDNGLREEGKIEKAFSNISLKILTTPNRPKEKTNHALMLWIKTLGYTNSMDVYRDKPKEQVMGETSPGPSTDRGPLNEVIESERRQLLSQCVAALGEEERRLFILRFGGGYLDIDEISRGFDCDEKLTYEKLSHILKMKPGMVRYKIEKAKEEVRNCMKKAGYNR
jgi:RNA polymerase sigma factor (sigma-70 family)